VTTRAIEVATEMKGVATSPRSTPYIRSSAVAGGQEELRPGKRPVFESDQHVRAHGNAAVRASFSAAL
jgi:hypothetical protein